MADTKNGGRRRYEDPRIVGGPPDEPFHNQNARMLDDVRIRSGIPLGQDYGMVVLPSLQPVFLADPDTAPLPRTGGFTQLSVAAGGAGMRSEIVIATQAADRSIVLEVYVDLFPPGAGTLTFQVVYACVVAAATRSNAPNADNRLNAWAVDNPAIFIGSKNSAAASGGGINGGAAIAVAHPIRIGPFYLDCSLHNGTTGRGNICIRPTADNTAINAQVTWRALQRVGTGP